MCLKCWKLIFDFAQGRGISCDTVKLIGSLSFLAFTSFVKFLSVEQTDRQSNETTNKQQLWKHKERRNETKQKRKKKRTTTKHPHPTSPQPTHPPPQT